MRRTRRASEGGHHEPAHPCRLGIRDHVDRPLHGRARQPRRDDRPAGHQAPTSARRCRSSSGRSTPTPSPSPCCSSPAPRSATASGGSASSSSGSRSSPPGSAFAALAPSGDDAHRSPARSRASARAIVTPLTLTILSRAVPRRAARPRARRVGRHRRPRDRARAARRRRDRRGPLLAVDLLAQRPDRPRRRSRSRPPGSPRATARDGVARPARPRPRVRRPARPRLGAHPRQRATAGRAPAIVGRVRCVGAVLLVGVRRLGGRGPLRPMLPLRFFRIRAFSAANGVSLPHVVRRVRRDLPPRPVLPGRPGVLAAPGRPAHAAVDRRCRSSSPRSPASSSDRIGRPAAPRRPGWRSWPSASAWIAAVATRRRRRT